MLEKINVLIDEEKLNKKIKEIAGYGLDYQEKYRNLPYVGYIE